MNSPSLAGLSPSELRTLVEVELRDEAYQRDGQPRPADVPGILTVSNSWYGSGLPGLLVTLDIDPSGSNAEIVRIPADEDWRRSFSGGTKEYLSYVRAVVAQARVARESSRRVTAALSAAGIDDQFVDAITPDADTLWQTTLSLGLREMILDGSAHWPTARAFGRPDLPAVTIAVDRPLWRASVISRVEVMLYDAIKAGIVSQSRYPEIVHAAVFEEHYALAELLSTARAEGLYIVLDRDGPVLSTRIALPAIAPHAP